MVSYSLGHVARARHHQFDQLVGAMLTGLSVRELKVAAIWTPNRFGSVSSDKRDMSVSSLSGRSA